MSDWETFTRWAKLEGVDLEMLTWKQTQSLIKDYENDKKQNSFNYKRANI